MGSKKKTTAAMPEINMQVLAAIVAATQSGSFIYTAPEYHTPMITLGLVEIAAAMINPANANEVATRATAKGIEMINSASTPEVQAPVKSKFEIEEGIPIPPAKRGGRIENLYPFESLAVGQSFFVPASEKKPDPAKSLASTVNSATARFATADPSGATRINRKGKTVPVMIEGRKFSVRPYEKIVDGVIVKGARIWRER
jgi:hypothetical protein